MWNKGKNLKILKENGFLIPDFLILWMDDNFKEKLEKLDQTKKYVVRSNMLVEDSKNSSFAGQFKTHIDLDFNEIISSIEDIISDAKNKWLSDKQIYVIVQEYIDFNYSWIVFSRNPNGNSEMLIEYHKWIWEDVVSWKVIPEEVWVYHFEKNYSSKFWKLKNSLWKKGIIKFVKSIKQIEKIFNFPQDIEWWIKWNKLYFLQSRDITTITEKNFREVLFLDNYIKKENEQSFLYEKTEVSEIIPKVSEFSFSLLKMIYGFNWPISKFYKSKGIEITHGKILKIIWRDLFIDKEEELNNIFPSITYFKEKYKTKTVFWRNIIRTLKNIYRINSIKFDSYKALTDITNIIKSLKNTDINKLNFEKILSIFIKNYQTIFYINYFTQKSMAQNDIYKRKFWVNLFDFLDTSLVKDNSLLEIKNLLKNIDLSQTKWNSLDILDSTDFQTNFLNKETKNLPEKYRNIKFWKKRFISKNIDSFQFFNDLREIWRILTVLGMNLIRKKLEILFTENSLNTELIPFIKISEIFENDFDKQILIKRRDDFYVYSRYTFQNKISDTYIKEKDLGINVLSSWKAIWKLVDLEYLNNSYKESEKYILYTRTLNPNLVDYFDKIEWIISEKWGNLSHLAIMCREYQIPLVVTDIKKYWIKNGDSIEINEEDIVLL